MLIYLKKWGNSFSIRVPNNFVKELDLQMNSAIEAHIDGHKLVLEPVATEKKLKDLLAKITDDNLHKEITTGGAQGKEVW